MGVPRAFFKVGNFRKGIQARPLMYLQVMKPRRANCRNRYAAPLGWPIDYGLCVCVGLGP